MSTDTAASESDSFEKIPQDVLNELRAAGASKLFIDVIQVRPEDVGVPRNSAREEVLKYVRWADESDGEVSEYLSYGGGFFQSLLRGRTGDADPNNKELIQYVKEGHNQETTGVVEL